MKYFKKYELIVITLLLFIDQFVKLFIDFNMNFGESKEVFCLLSIEKLYNFGISFSFLNGSIYLIILLSIIALSYLVYLKKDYLNTKFINSGLLLVFIGGIGNLIDRVHYGYVIDYLKVNIENLNFPIFNIADIFVSIGFILVIVGIVKREYEN